MNKKFDLPYNFDTNLIDFYNIFFKNNKQLISSIYLPPYKNHYITAKHYSILQNKNLIYPKNENEYFEHISYFQKFNFDKKIMLLLQNNNNLIDKINLKFYIDNNITKFCVGSIEQAKEIKDLLPEAEITASITMKLMPDDLNNNLTLYKKYFNNVVLWFPYNRNISLIKQLPKDFKYILLINCFCAKTCDGTHHWLAQNENEENIAYKNCPKKYALIKDLIYIPPQHLPLFEPYIFSYKLQGREYLTNDIINDVVKYTTPINKLNLFETQIPLTAYNL